MIFFDPANSMKEIIKLKKYVDTVISSLVPFAAEHNCRLANELSPDASLVTDKEAFLFIMRRLLQLVIHSSHNSTISITDLIKGDRFLILIDDDNNDYKGFISGKMEKHQSIIRRAGCCLSFEFRDRRSITVILQFANK